MDQNSNILSDELLRAGVWRAGELRQAPGNPTGFPMLDSLLPTQGWPIKALTEILSAEPGLGALRLVLPSVAAISANEQWVIWVCPPHIPYVPALQSYDINFQKLLIIEPEEDARADNEYKLWVFEQALRFYECGLALVWLDSAQPVQLRRLQLAAEAGNTSGILFRHEACAKESSPAALRLKIAVNPEDSATLNILKSRGQVRERICELSL